MLGELEAMKQAFVASRGSVRPWCRAPDTQQEVSRSRPPKVGRDLSNYFRTVTADVREIPCEVSLDLTFHIIQ